MNAVCPRTCLYPGQADKRSLRLRTFVLQGGRVLESEKLGYRPHDVGPWTWKQLPNSPNCEAGETLTVVLRGEVAPLELAAWTLRSVVFAWRIKKTNVTEFLEIACSFLRGNDYSTRKRCPDLTTREGESWHSIHVACCLLRVRGCTWSPISLRSEQICP